MAAHQFLVEKRVEGERTNTSVRLLSPKERISEVARMLGGADGSEGVIVATTRPETMLGDTGVAVKILAIANGEID